jgi:hypothetical protein
MSEYHLLDACEQLKVVDACDIHTFRQFLEVQRLDKKRRRAVYPGKGDALKRKYRHRKSSKYVDRIRRAVDIAQQLKGQGFPFGHLYQLAAHEQRLGLPPSGEGSHPMPRRLELLRALERHTAGVGRLGFGGGPFPGGPAVSLPAVPALGQPGNIFDALKGLLGQLPVIPLPAEVDPVDQPVWAIGIDYAQEWCCLGYGRGRLIRSIPLTPNETVEIVTKTWNKRTDRRQDLQSAENDVSTEFIGDEKWSLATRKELTASVNGSVNGNVQQHADISLPIDVVDVSAGGSSGLGGNLGSSLTQTIAETTENVKQETIKAANRLKTTVTSTVETVAEVGREVTQTQKLSNPNRCHSVTYHFFEIAEKYRVRTRPVAVAPYLLVPLDRPPLTADWLLCHECELKALLPCEAYYEGFKAAKLLKAREQLGLFLGSFDSPAIQAAAASLIALLQELVATYTELSRAGLLSGESEGGGLLGAVAGLIDGGIHAAQDAGKTAQEIVDAVVETGAQVLDTIVETGGEIIAGIGNLFGVQALAAPPGARALSFPIQGEGGGGPGSFVYWEIVKIMAPELEAALTALAERAAGVVAMPDGPEKTRAVFDALNAFFAQVGDVQAAFDKINMVAGVISFAVPFAVIAVGLGGLGLTGFILSALLALVAVGVAAVADGVDAADLLPDDEGLEELILRARGQLQNLGSLSLLPAEPGPDASKEERASYERALQDMKREQFEVALAQVEFDRLTCHLDENFEYYNQTLWLQKPASAIQARLELYDIPLRLVDQRIVGFVRNLAAFRVNEALLTGDFDWQKEVKRLKLDELLAAPPAESAIELPTPGMTVEPALGACCGCDDFVMKHRELDLQNRAAEVALAEAKAAQEQFEAKRLEERIKAGELSDPTPFESAQTRVIVTPEGEQP